MLGTSIAPQPVVVGSAPSPVVSAIAPQIVPAPASPPMMVQAMPLQQAYPYQQYQQYPYGYGYSEYTQKRENPLKRFFKGAADGFMLGTVGWMG
ncbi:unnamed protein product [Strongylus vulgaris]|uniref:Uncharacterized protein n=1 Tax=Strongylus vulgaris TaxID=40348 RepID=A0A3P7LPG2_STRVU|nr:unnamed protein product [Strongylus vulgaris]